MASTLEQIDQQLADWRKKLDLIGQNLIDLHGNSAYQRLTGDGGIPQAQLTGVTQVKVTSALAAMNDLFQHFELLVQTINQAIALRKQITWFLGSEQKLTEIEQLLSGASVQLAVEQIPLCQRGLLSASEAATAIAPSDLLTAMTHAFQVAKDAVLTVDYAWSNLELKLAHATGEIDALNQLAASLNIPTETNLETAQAAIAILQNQIDCDPLGVTSEFEHHILPLLKQARATLEQTAHQQTQTQNNLTSAHKRLQQLTELNQQAIAAFAESQDKVVDHSTLRSPLAQCQIDALHQWLNRLEAKFSEGLYHPVNVGLTNWNTNADTLIQQETKTLATNRSPTDTRRELRGRLDALTAKALARGKVENPTLSHLAEQAKHLLYGRPTPLAEAADLVSQYEKHLNQLL